MVNGRLQDFLLAYDTIQLPTRIHNNTNGMATQYKLGPNIFHNALTTTQLQCMQHLAFVDYVHGHKDKEVLRPLLSTSISQRLLKSMSNGDPN